MAIEILGSLRLLNIIDTNPSSVDISVLQAITQNDALGWLASKIGAIQSQIEILKNSIIMTSTDKIMRTYEQIRDLIMINKELYDLINTAEADIEPVLIVVYHALKRI